MDNLKAAVRKGKMQKLFYLLLQLNMLSGLIMLCQGNRS